MTQPPPKHYPSGQFEPWNVIEAWGLGYNLGNVAKYIARAGKKGSRLDDLVKARNYLDREIDLEAAKVGAPSNTTVTYSVPIGPPHFNNPRTGIWCACRECEKRRPTEPGTSQRVAEAEAFVKEHMPRCEHCE